MTTRLTWIKVHSHLLEPKHQKALGERVWLFLYLIDKADWETGKVPEYTDAEAAEDLGRSKRTVERWRQDLEKRGYIACRQILHAQEVTIHRWRNPRHVNAEPINLPQESNGTQICLEVHGTQHGTQHGRQNCVPSPAQNEGDSQITDHKTDSGAGAPQGNSRPAKAKRTPREKGKPRPPRKRSDLEKAVIEGSFGIPGDQPLGKDEGYLVGRVVDWLKKDASGETAADVRQFYGWFARQYPGASAPRDRAKFATHYRAYKAAADPGSASPGPAMGAPEIEDGPEYTTEERERIINLLKEARNGKSAQPAPA